MILGCVLMIIVSIIVFITSYHQNDYHLTNEHMELVSQDNDFISVTIKNFMYNRTIKAINSTIVIKKNIESDLMGTVQGYKFASNEYRLFPIVFERNICSAITDNEFGIQNILHCGNFTECPLKKGFYHICNWIPDDSQFPPYVPSGDYKFDLKLHFRSRQITHVSWYVKVVKRFYFP